MTATENPALTRWQRQHDIHCAYIDAGYACTWFAQQGEQEPVSGETEELACARLARELGLKGWEL